MSPGGGHVHVDRLSLQVTGMDDDSARNLSRLVAEGLVPLLGRATAGIGLDHLRVDVPAPNAGQSAHTDTASLLAARILQGIGRALDRGDVVASLGEEGTL